MKQPKIGSPKLPKGEAKSEMVRARVTPMEYRAVEAAAITDGLDLSEWVRSIIVSAALKHG